MIEDEKRTYYIALVEHGYSATVDWGDVPADYVHDRHQKLIDDYLMRKKGQVLKGTYVVAQPNGAGLNLQIFRVDDPPKPPLAATRAEVVALKDTPL